MSLANSTSWQPLRWMLGGVLFKQFEVQPQVMSCIADAVKLHESWLSCCTTALCAGRIVQPDALTVHPAGSATHAAAVHVAASGLHCDCSGCLAAVLVALPICQLLPAVLVELCRELTACHGRFYSLSALGVLLALAEPFSNSKFGLRELYQQYNHCQLRENLTAHIVV